MVNYYKIDKINANIVGEFEYGIGEAFSPFCSEQVDGTYLVEVSLVENPTRFIQKEYKIISLL